MTASKTVVVVDDDVLITVYLRTLCETFGSQVVGVAHDAAVAEDTILRERPDYVFMDLRLGGPKDGVDVARSVLAQLPLTQFIFVTGSSEEASASRIESVHPKHVLIKPVDISSVQAALA